MATHEFVVPRSIVNFCGASFGVTYSYDSSSDFLRIVADISWKGRISGKRSTKGGAPKTLSQDSCTEHIVCLWIETEVV